MQEFIQMIKTNLENNGFPVKKVSLPTEKMYEAADKKGLSLNAVLEKMHEDEGIQYTIGNDKIVFNKVVVDQNSFPNLNPAMFEKVQEMMSQMAPEQLNEIQDKVANMSEEERSQMLEQAKGMGLF